MIKAFETRLDELNQRSLAQEYTENTAGLPQEAPDAPDAPNPCDAPFQVETNRESNPDGSSYRSAYSFRVF